MQMTGLSKKPKFMSIESIKRS